MNIAFDATAILGPMSKNRGIGNYALSQFKTMIERNKKNNYFLINFFEEFTLKDYIKDASNLKEVYFDCGKDRFLLSNPKYKQIIGDIIKNFIKENEINIFYITSPFDNNVICYEKEWFKDIKTVATVYDVIPYVLRKTYLTDRNTYKWYMSCVDMLRWVDRFLVISESVKDDMIKHLQFDTNKIDVIYGAVDEIYKEIEIDKEDKHKLFSKFNIKNDYIMCTGGDDSRKNIGELIIAYAKMPKELMEKYQLVIVCKLSEHAVEHYTDIIIKNNVAGKVVLTNFVSIEELLKLYNLATIMAFPSKYEGFGLPVVEAWACGTPVLTSNNSSLGEIVEDGAVTVDPFSIEDITRGLVESLTLVDLEELLQKGKERLKLFQWDRVADLSIEAINKMNINRIEKVENKKRIAFFTPLPPIQSGISDYSVDILNGISDYFDIDVFIDDGYEPNGILGKDIKIYNHKEFEKRSRNYDDIVYQMGNSYYHEYMHKYVKKYKGTLVLHDYNMHGVVQAISLNKKHNDIRLYKKYLLEDFSEKEVDEYLTNLKIGQTGLKINEMEINGFVCNYANKIIVHSDYSKGKLLERNIAHNISTIPHYAKIEEIIDNRELKKEKGIDNNEIIIASFGHIHETKRAMPILEAFNRLTKKYNNIRYIFVGKLDESLKEGFKEYIEKHNLQQKVIVTGYTELKEFEEYIDLVDICMNLRYPYNGETSGSLMRILAKGKSVVVNNIGSFGEIPDECCIKLPLVDENLLKKEIGEIYKVMEELINNEHMRSILSHNARIYAEKNLDIKIIAKQYKEAIICSKSSILNEKIIQDIVEFEIKNKRYTEQDIIKISRTLGYCKNL